MVALDTQHSGAWHQRTHTRSYKIHVAKKGYTSTRTAHHIKQMPITTEQYLCNEIRKVKTNIRVMMTLMG